MRFILSTITDEILDMQRHARTEGRKLKCVYLTNSEMIEYAEECRKAGRDDPRKEKDTTYFKGTAILLEPEDPRPVNSVSLGG